MPTTKFLAQPTCIVNTSPLNPTQKSPINKKIRALRA